MVPLGRYGLDSADRARGRRLEQEVSGCNNGGRAASERRWAIVKAKLISRTQ
jgi:hypothetical protein